MDFDSIISFLLIILFFVLPTILKRLNQKKKPAAPAGAVKTKNMKSGKVSLFEKIGAQIREYAKNLEQEAQQEKQSRETEENIWDRLADDKDFETTHEDTFEQDFEPEIYAAEPAAEPSGITEAPVVLKKRTQAVSKPEKSIRTADLSFPAVGPSRLSSGQLQQAVVWSEILSEPVALRRY